MMDGKFTTLGDLLTEIESRPEDALVFTSGNVDIGAGYHVTEFKQVAIKSIDCGQRTDAWNETLLQLLDGAGDAHMSVATFVGIAQKSASVLHGLADASFFVEFAPGNKGLRRLKVQGVINEENRVTISLVDDVASCKPMVDWQHSAHRSCCGGEPNRVPCCT